MSIVFVDQEDFPKKLGKFPDYLVKGIGKPSFVGGKIRGAYQLGKILYKTGAWRRVGRYYGFRYRKRITAGVAGGLIASSLYSVPVQSPEQTRKYMVKSKSKRLYGANGNFGKRCQVCRC